MLVAPSVSELATHIGTTEGALTSFATEALDQATHLFQLATGVDAWPTSELSLKTAKRGVFDMADFIYNWNPYRGVKARPFTAETVGNYSRTINLAMAGKPAGLMWWDEAVKLLATDDVSEISSGGTTVFENDGVWVDRSGEKSYPGPGGLKTTRTGGYTTEVLPDEPFWSFDGNCGY